MGDFNKLGVIISKEAKGENFVTYTRYSRVVDEEQYKKEKILRVFKH